MSVLHALMAELHYFVGNLEAQRQTGGQFTCSKKITTDRNKKKNKRSKRAFVKSATENITKALLIMIYSCFA